MQEDGSRCAVCGCSMRAAFCKEGKQLRQRVMDCVQEADRRYGGRLVGEVFVAYYAAMEAYEAHLNAGQKGAW